MTDNVTLQQVVYEWLLDEAYLKFLVALLPMVDSETSPSVARGNKIPWSPDKFQANFLWNQASSLAKHINNYAKLGADKYIWSPLEAKHKLPNKAGAMNNVTAM